jgi:hypothetical protein
MRVVATMPWAVQDDLEILPVRHAALLRGLADSELVRYIEKLSRCRGSGLSATAWDTSPFSNTSDRLGCECRLATPDGRTIVTAEVLMHLPGAGSSSVVTCVQVSVHDLDAWRESRAAEVRLSTTEVAEFYAIAAVATTTTLSTALGDPLPTRYLSPPKVQLVLATDAEDHTKPRPLLDQYVALEPLGQNGRGPTDSLEIAVTTAPLVESAWSAELMRDALAFAARRFGFSGATAGNFE